MGAFGDEARRYASGANWLRLSSGDVAELQILEIGAVRDKAWDRMEGDDGEGQRVDKVIDLEVYLYSLTKPGKPAEVVNAARRFDPKCAWISDLIDLSDRLDKATGTAGTIRGHRLRLIRADKPGPKGFRYGHIEVVDLGASTVPQAGQAAPAVAASRPAPSSASPTEYLARIRAAGDLGAVKVAWQEANAVGLGRDPQILAEAGARKEAILSGEIAQAKEDADLVYMTARVQDEAKGEMLARLQAKIDLRRDAFAVDDDVPF